MASIFEHETEGRAGWSMQMGDQLLTSVKKLITPDFISTASKLIGETPEKSQAGFFSAIPAILMGLINKGSTSEGGRSLINLIQGGGYESGVPANLLDLLKGGKTTESYLEKGAHALSGIFGDKSAMVVSKLAQGMGTSSSVSNKILSLAAPLVMGTLGSKVKALGLNASSLTNFLSQQKTSLAGMIPEDIAKKMGAVEPLFRTQEQTSEEHAESRGDWPENRQENRRENRQASRDETNVDEKGKRNFVPLGLGALLLLGGFFALRGRHGPEITQPPSQAQEQAGTVTQEQAGTVTQEQAGIVTQEPLASPLVTDQLTTFLESDSDQELPRRFTFNTLKFSSGRTELIPGAEITIEEIATALKNHPTTVVRLESFTDNTGNPDINQRLSLARAEAVKKALLDKGIEDTRIHTAGRSSSSPVASNATPEGRNLNRRIEVLVLQK